MINTKPLIRNKFKELLSELNKFKVQTVVVFAYKKRNNLKLFHLSLKLMATGSEIDEAFISMRHSIATKIKNHACEDWIVLDVIMKYSIKTFVH